MTRVVTPMLALLAAGCAHGVRFGQPVALDSFLAFADPVLCEPAEAHSKLLGAMVAGDANEGFRAGRVEASAQFLPAFGRIRVEPHPSFTTISVPVRGTLFGLPLVTIVQTLPDGGDPGAVSYRFAANVEQVQLAANRHGLPAVAGQSRTIGPPDGYEHFIELERDPARPGRSLLTCGYQ